MAIPHFGTAHAQSLRPGSGEQISRRDDSQKTWAVAIWALGFPAGIQSRFVAMETVMNTTATKARREAPLATPTDLTSNATKDLSGALTTLLAGRIRALSQDQEFSLAHVGPATFATIICCSTNKATRFLPSRTRSPNVCARSEARHCARSAMLGACNGCSTTTRITSRHSTCWPSCATTTSSSPSSCVKPTSCARNHSDVATASLPFPRCGSMKPSAEPGSCSRQSRAGEQAGRGLAICL